MEQILKEYEMLRQEINQKIELHNTLLTFTITSTILVLTVAASEKMTSLYLFPFCVIIPMLLRIAYYRKTMAKLSAYMIVFLEPAIKDLNWESRNYAFSKKYGGLSSEKRKVQISCFECFALGCVCYALYLLNCFPIECEKATKVMIFDAIWPVALLIWIAQITHKTSRFDKERDEFIRKWNNIKMSEASKGNGNS